MPDGAWTNGSGYDAAARLEIVTSQAGASNTFLVRMSSGRPEGCSQFTFAGEKASAGKIVESNMTLR